MIYALSTLLQVFNRLQKMLSHKSTLRVLDEAAEGHDEKVWDWRESLVERAMRTADYASVRILLCMVINS